MNQKKLNMFYPIRSGLLALTALALMGGASPAFAGVTVTNCDIDVSGRDPFGNPAYFYVFSTYGSDPPDTDSRDSVHIATGRTMSVRCEERCDPGTFLFNEACKKDGTQCNIKIVFVDNDGYTVVVEKSGVEDGTVLYVNSGKDAWADFTAGGCD